MPSNTARTRSPGFASSIPHQGPVVTMVPRGTMAPWRVTCCSQAGSSHAGSPRECVPVKACGFGGQSLKFKPEGRDIRDHYAVVFDYGNQRQVEYSHSWIAAKNVPCDGRRELVYGEKGEVDVEEAMLYLHGAEKREQLPIEPKGDSTQLAVDDFFRCIREGTQPLCNAERGRNAALVGLLGRKALDTGKVVTMKELLAEG